jgi:hypothetical protein
LYQKTYYYEALTEEKSSDGYILLQAYYIGYIYGPLKFSSAVAAIQWVLFPSLYCRDFGYGKTLDKEMGYKINKLVKN